MNSTFI